MDSGTGLRAELQIFPIGLMLTGYYQNQNKKSSSTTDCHATLYLVWWFNIENDLYLIDKW